MSAHARAQRDDGLRRLRSLNAGMVFVSVAAIGVASAGVAAAVPGRKSTPPATGQTAITPNNSAVTTTTGDDGTVQQVPQQAPQQVNPNTNPPVVTSGGS